MDDNQMNEIDSKEFSKRKKLLCHAFNAIMKLTDEQLFAVMERMRQENENA